MGIQHNLNNTGSVLLQVRNVSKRFGGVAALSEVDVDVRKGEILSVIGPNGSGKTTLFNCVTGYLRPDVGQILFKGYEITRKRTDQIALLGICRTFQSVSIFPSLTVLENLLVSLQQHQEENIFNRLFRFGNIRQFERQAYEKAAYYLELVQLQQFCNDKSELLVYGQRKLLEFACALISDPDLVMLDEPVAGVNTSMVDQIKQIILSFNQEGKTFLIVEHNMGVVMDVSERIIVLDNGIKIAEGVPNVIRDNELVQRAYFGG